MLYKDFLVTGSLKCSSISILPTWQGCRKNSDVKIWCLGNHRGWLWIMFLVFTSSTRFIQNTTVMKCYSVIHEKLALLTNVRKYCLSYFWSSGLILNISILRLWKVLLCVCVRLCVSVCAAYIYIYIFAFCFLSWSSQTYLRSSQTYHNPGFQGTPCHVSQNEGFTKQFQRANWRPSVPVRHRSIQNSTFSWNKWQHPIIPDFNQYSEIVVLLFSLV